MIQKVITARTTPVVTPAQLAAFGRFDLPQQYVTGSSPQVETADYSLLELFISASTDQVETMAQTACETEQIYFTLDFFPNTQDPRNFMQYQLSYAYNVTPWWWYGFPAKDSIELVRRPVQIPALSISASVTAVSVANNTVTVTSTLNPGAGKVVVLSGTAEGNVSNPFATPSTTPFLNGVPLTVMTSNSSQFTANFNNFYTMSGTGVVTPQSYTNNSDMGTATLVNNPLIVTYFDGNGVLCTWNTIYYYVQDNKVTLTVGSIWPLTDRRQDCIQITYWAGSTSTPANVEARLQMAVLYLANHMWENRTLVTIDPTSEVWGTLCMMLSSYRTFRIPR